MSCSMMLEPASIREAGLVFILSQSIVGTLIQIRGLSDLLEASQYSSVLVSGGEREPLFDLLEIQHFLSSLLTETFSINLQSLTVMTSYSVQTGICIGIFLEQFIPSAHWKLEYKYC